jgi:dolichol-phosphate mannosyltransferase
MIGIVTPTYNEAGNLPTLIKGLEYLEAQLIVVDDCSSDGTADIAEAAGAHVIRREGKLGLASAYVHGMTTAIEMGFDTIVQMDADLSHQPADVGRLVDGMKDNDLILGSRWVPGGGIENWEASRQLLSRFGSGYARTLLGLPFQDLTGGFKVWRAETLRDIELQTIRSEGYAFQIETTYRAHRLGARIEEIPIVFAERLSGDSKMSWDIAIEAAWVVPALRWRGR